MPYQQQVHEILSLLYEALNAEVASDFVRTRIRIAANKTERLGAQLQAFPKNQEQIALHPSSMSKEG